MNKDELKSIRAILGETQASLAERLGVSPRTVENWEIGHRNIPETVARLLKTLAPRKRRVSRARNYD